jgi:hypothetical protein
LPPHGQSQDWEFDPTIHYELEPEKKEGEEGEEENEEEDEDVEKYDENGKVIPKEPKVWKLCANFIYMNWLYISPDKRTILMRLNEILNNGLQSLMVFERWSKHDDLSPYADVLEEWDDMVGDDWEAPEKNFLNPFDWIKEDQFYKE